MITPYVTNTMTAMIYRDMSATTPTIWDTPGTDKYYEHYRQSTSDTSKDLHKWVDEAYYKNNLAQYLDKDFLKNLRDEDFYGRLWELELAEWLVKTGLKLVPTKGKGPDFCIELGNGSKLWVEAVLSRPDDKLKNIQTEALQSQSHAYSTPRDETALRYTTSLSTKINKITANYSTIIKEKDIVLIGVSAFAPGAMWSNIDLFMRAVLPVDDQLVHFSTDGKPLDTKVSRPSHTIKSEIINSNGSPVNTEFLYPATEFPQINGVIFSEASNLQQLLGTMSSKFDESTNTPHVFQRYGHDDVPKSFTDTFYYHKFRNNGDMVTLDQFEPSPNSGLQASK